MDERIQTKNYNKYKKKNKPETSIAHLTNKLCVLKCSIKLKQEEACNYNDNNNVVKSKFNKNKKQELVLKFLLS